MKTCYNVAPFTLITLLLVGTKRSMSVENICLLCFSPAGPNSKLHWLTSQWSSNQKYYNCITDLSFLLHIAVSAVKSEFFMTEDKRSLKCSKFLHTLR